MTLSRRSTACWNLYEASAISRWGKALLDALDHAPHSIDRRKVFPRALLHVEREPLEEPGAAERVDGVRDAAFVRDDLLRSERQRRGLSSRQSQCFVQRVRVE